MKTSCNKRPQGKKCVNPMEFTNTFVSTYEISKSISHLIYSSKAYVDKDCVFQMNLTAERPYQIDQPCEGGVASCASSRASKLLMRAVIRASEAYIAA